MEIIKTTLDEVTNQVFSKISDQSECIIYHVFDENCAIVGRNGGSNIDRIRKHGIRMVEINHEGGTIVASPGDISIGIFTKDYKGREYRDDIVIKIINRLRENGHDASIDGNDVVIDGRKVVGYGSRRFGNILYTAIHIAVNTDLELIKAVCTKDMNKIPDALSNYGIYTEDVLGIMSDVFGQKLK